MKRLLPLILAAGLLAPPVAAGDGATEGATGFEWLMDEGAKALLRGIIRDMGPQSALLAQLEELMRLMVDAEDYHRPEVLPNGDVLIRRKAPLPPAPPRMDGAPDGSAVDL